MPAIFLLIVMVAVIIVLASWIVVQEMRKRRYQRHPLPATDVSPAPAHSTATVPLPATPESAFAAPAKSSTVEPVAEPVLPPPHPVTTKPLQMSDEVQATAQTTNVEQVPAHPPAMTDGVSTSASAAYASKAHIADRPLVVISGKQTDLGLVRQINEDSLIVSVIERACDAADLSLRLYAVADGMGGHEAGEVASRLALTHLAVSLLQQALLPEATQQTIPSPSQMLKSAGQKAARSVYEEARRSRTDMGTTLAAAVVDEVHRKVYVINVGDSRVYKINANKICQITKDHSLVQRLVDSNQLTPEEARNHPNANLIYRTLGEKSNVEIDTFEQALEAGDYLLLCSDGLCGLVENKDIQAAVIGGDSPQAACAQLIEMAKQAGGYDNISAIVVSLHETGLRTEV